MSLSTRPALSRKRSRLDADDYDDDANDADDGLKKSRTQCDLDELDVICASDAWRVDIDAVLGGREWPRYRRGRSTVVVCVMGNMTLHYDLLCAALPSLYTGAPTMQALVLCHDPTTHKAAATSTLPLVRAVTPASNHFVSLGLLHPLGGGTTPLDALAVVDRLGRRRLVLPFGWGAGKHADTPAGRSIQGRLMGLLRHCVEVLETEAETQA